MVCAAVANMGMEYVSCPTPLEGVELDCFTILVSSMDWCGALGWPQR